MRRGEVWWVAFGPSYGGEIRKDRPAIIVSNDASNRHLNRVQIVPLTSNTERVYPSDALVTLAGTPIKAMADQLTTVAKSRLTHPAGVVSPADLRRVEQAIRVQLSLGNAGSAVADV
ncbi:MAG: type II toxin-antitoxin system PemK/MazF family toxin [Thermoleophilia bacterium]|nr:type II toxin-antitoxin system PemK/MazF family toxin [Thermoleophilia bacterium]